MARGLGRKVRRGADEHQPLDTVGLLGRHVQQGHATATHPDGLEALDSEMVAQGKHILGGLLHGELAGGVGRAAVPAHVGNDQPLVSTQPVEVAENRRPGVARHEESVEQRPAVRRPREPGIGCRCR